MQASGKYCNCSLFSSVPSDSFYSLLFPAIQLSCPALLCLLPLHQKPENPARNNPEFLSTFLKKSQHSERNSIRAVPLQCPLHDSMPFPSSAIYQNMRFHPSEQNLRLQLQLSMYLFPFFFLSLLSGTDVHYEKDYTLQLCLFLAILFS